MGLRVQLTHELYTVQSPESHDPCMTRKENISAMVIQCLRHLLSFVLSIEKKAGVVVQGGCKG